MALPTGFASEIDRLLSDFQQPGSPGVALAITQDGEEVLTRIHGLASINHGVALDRHSILRIASQTKQFTVLLVLMLEAEGKLRLSDPVRDHLDFVPRHLPAFTIAQCCANTGGFRDHLEGLLVSGRLLSTPADRALARDWMRRQEALNFTPGSALLYSNAGFVMLSDIIEQIEGKSFAAVLEERITGPLGMRDTAILARDGTAGPRLAARYTKMRDGWSDMGWGLELSGEGAMVSSLNDMVLWQQNLIRPRIGTPAMFERMASPFVFNNGADSVYGLGFVTETYRGRRAIGHGGFVAGCKSESMRFVDDGLGIVILSNCDQIAPYSLAHRIADAWFADPAPAPIAFRPGRYRQEGGVDMFGIVEKAGVARFEHIGGLADFDFTYPTGAKPELATKALSLRPREDGRIDAIFCGEPRVYAPLPPAATAGRPLAGRYVNAMQGMTVEIAGDRRNGTFELRSPFGVVAAELVALDHECWLLRGFRSEIHPGEPWNAVLRATETGFEFTADRVKRLHFDRVAD